MEEKETEVKKGFGKKIGVAGVIIAGLAAGAYALVKKFSNDDNVVIDDFDDEFEPEVERPIVEEKKPEEEQ